MTAGAENGWCAVLARWTGLIAICASGVWAAEPAETFHFGTAALGVPITNRFMLRHDGANSLEIRSITPSCDCIQILQGPARVEAGSTGVVEVLFMPDKPGEVDYRVYVKTSVSDMPDIEYAIQGIVAPAGQTRKGRDWACYLEAQEAATAFDNPGGVTWVDVRNEEAYAHMRMPASLRIPLHAVKSKSFLRGRHVVLVDEGHGSRALEKECRKLRGLGFPDLSIWYGGINAWHRRGGVLESDGSLDASRVPPAAMREIVDATDWLVVVAAARAPDGPEGTVAIPFDPTRKGDFVAALETALESRPQIASVLIASQSGENYDALAEATEDLDAVVFFLEGGWAAWQKNQKMMDAMQNSRPAVVRAGSTTARPGGCGGCPK